MVRADDAALARASEPHRAPRSGAFGAAAALSATLVEAGARPELLRKALRALATLAPALAEARVFGVSPQVAAGQALLELATFQAAHDGPYIVTHAEPEPQTTLGLGDEADHDVLARGRVARHETRLALPLCVVTGEAGEAEIELLGALTLTGRAPLDPKTPAFALAQNVLAALLARWAREEEAARLRDEVEAQSEARDAFISLAAHELRGPLTSVRGYAQLLTRQARKLALPDAMRRSVEAVEQQTVRMTEMVGELLDASHIRQGRFELREEPTDLVPIARRVVERRLAVAAQPSITLDLDAPSLAGEWNAAAVEHALRDLLDNAIRFSPEEQPITIRLARLRDAQGEWALVSVRDQGIGVAPDERERIFDYLYRSPTAERRNLSGLGLGLYVSRAIVERLGGRLWLEWSSVTPPTGSKFSFTLPLSQDASGVSVS